MIRLLFGITLLVGTLSFGVQGTEPPQAPTPRLVPLDDLVQQLSSPDYDTREAASKRLGSLALAPPPALLAASKSESPDLRERASDAIRAMRRNLAATRLPRGEKFAERGAIDLFVAATAEWDLRPDDPRLWEPALEVGRSLLKKAEMTGSREPNECPATFRDFAAYKRRCNPKFTRLADVYQRLDNKPTKLQPTGIHPEAIQAQGVSDSESFNYNVAIARGDVVVKSTIQTSLVLANGNINVGQQVLSAILICDGDVEIGDQFSSVLVVARGNIRAKRAVASVLACGGTITLSEQNKRPLVEDQFNVISENAVKPLGITFFELSTVGVAVKVTDGVVSVSAVEAGKSFAKAGVQVSDIITKVNGKKPDSAESLRRLLRDALAIGDATVTVRRDDKTETMKVSLPD